MRLPVKYLLPLGAPIFLASCMGGGAHEVLSTAVSTNGPEADYPVVVGDSFTVGSTTYTPEDRLNYDAVGYAMVGEGSDARIAAAHKTLPLPSYVEVTELINGRTILVRVETRGPMRNDMLLELTPGAAIQLGISTSSAPIRVRRVNPAEVERAMLRAGDPAPLRIDTPKPLVAVLKRKLDTQQPLQPSGYVAPPVPLPAPTEIAAAPTPTPAPVPTASPVTQPVIEEVNPNSGVLPPVPSSPNPSPAPTSGESVKSVESTKPVQAPKPAVVKAAAVKKSGSRYVQVGAFSTKERADAAAKPLKATVSTAGKYWAVRMGPFNSVEEATAALEKAKKSGYRDAIVRRVD